MFAFYRTSVTRLIAITAIVLVVWLPRPSWPDEWVTESFELLGYVLLCLAACGRIWCLVFIAGRKKDLLMTEGPYSVVRNPLYVFSFLGAVGFGFAARNMLFALVIALLFAVYYPLTVRSEERELLELFGADFREYEARTPRWIPNFRLYHEPAVLAVHPAKIRKGILDAMWFLWSFLFWELLEVVRDRHV